MMKELTKTSEKVYYSITQNDANILVYLTAIEGDCRQSNKIQHIALSTDSLGKFATKKKIRFYSSYYIFPVSERCE